jgi:hypothetical protein
LASYAALLVLHRASHGVLGGRRHELIRLRSWWLGASCEVLLEGAVVSVARGKLVSQVSNRLEHLPSSS